MGVHLYLARYGNRFDFLDHSTRCIVLEIKHVREFIRCVSTYVIITGQYIVSYTHSCTLSLNSVQIGRK